MATPTSPADLERINTMFASLTDFLSNLFGRWQDEREYEDIADYGKAIAAQLPEGFKLIAMQKRPFGFKFGIGTDAVYKMTANSRSIGWERSA